MTTFTSTAACAPARPIPSRRTTDAPTRTFHWLFALCFAGAYLTADGERWRLVHVVLGYSMAGLLVFRLLYGLVGPRQVRLSALWGKVAAAGPWWRNVQHLWTPGRTAPSLSSLARQGQNIAMAAAIVALLLAVLPLTLSGYATYNDWGGEWLEDIHETVGEAFLWLVLAHLGLILLISLWRRQNQALPMLTGRTAGPGPDLVKRNHGWLALLLLAAVLAYWTWEWQNAPTAPVTNATAWTSPWTADDRDDD